MPWEQRWAESGKWQQDTWGYSYKLKRDVPWPKYPLGACHVTLNVACVRHKRSSPADRRSSPLSYVWFCNPLISVQITFAAVLIIVLLSEVSRLRCVFIVIIFLSSMRICISGSFPRLTLCVLVCRSPSPERTKGSPRRAAQNPWAPGEGLPRDRHP